MKAAWFALALTLPIVAGCSRSVSHTGPLPTDKFLVALNDDNFEAEVLKSDKPVLVDFWAEWCGPCKAIGPTISELAGEFEGRVKVGKFDIDQGRKTPEKYGINAIPALLVFKDGKLVEQLEGVKPKSQLTEMLTKVAGSK